jgi:hypothetical protein
MSKIREYKIRQQFYDIVELIQSNKLEFNHLILEDGTHIFRVTFDYTDMDYEIRITKRKKVFIDDYNKQVQMNVNKVIIEELLLKAL